MLIRQSVLDRYLLREGATTWAGVTVVLLAIMLATRFARFLAEAASGQLPREFLLKVVALSSLQYLVILIPVSLLLAVLLTLGRMYRDNEVAAMTGCGVGPLSLYRPILWLGVCIAALTGALSFQIGPWAGRQVDAMIKDARRLIQFTPFEAGRFKVLHGGRGVFYTAHMSERGEDLETVFAVVREQERTSVITAQRGQQELDPATGERVVRLEEGYRYAGEAGRADYDKVRFGTFTTRVRPPELVVLSSKRKIRETGLLVGSEDPEDQAELEWRIAAPLSVLLLALIAVPLAHAAPRQGRYNQIVYGLLAYLLYSNLLAVGQAAIARGVVPAGIGLWWVHALAAVAALWLVARRLGWSWASLRGAPA